MLELYAHYDKETGEKQLLINHLENVANDAASVAKKIGQADALSGLRTCLRFPLSLRNRFRASRLLPLAGDCHSPA